MRGVQGEMTSDLGVGYGEHRRTDAQTSCDSAGSSDTGQQRTQSLLITGDKPETQPLERPELEPVK